MILRIGHRGAAGYAPENTIASIRKAISLGCDLVEVDVRRTGDGHLVLLHDERVDRTTNGRGLLAHMSLREVRKLDAGGGERIPTLAEALQAVNGQVGLVLELKEKGIGEQVCRILREQRFTGLVIYASFIHQELCCVKAAEPLANTMALFRRLSKDRFSRAAQAEASYIGLRFDTVTKPLIKTFHDAGLTVLTYTPNTPSDIERLCALGVDGLISDFPDRISRSWQSR